MEMHYVLVHFCRVLLSYTGIIDLGILYY